MVLVWHWIGLFVRSFTFSVYIYTLWHHTCVCCRSCYISIRVHVHWKKREPTQQNERKTYDEKCARIHLLAFSFFLNNLRIKKTSTSRKTACHFDSFYFHFHFFFFLWFVHKTLQCMEYDEWFLKYHFNYITNH